MKGAGRPLEKLFATWTALHLNVGRDKKLGPAFDDRDVILLPEESPGPLPPTSTSASPPGPSPSCSTA